MTEKWCFRLEITFEGNGDIQSKSWRGKEFRLLAIQSGEDN
jgi:hypothetical protein